MLRRRETEASQNQCWPEHGEVLIFATEALSKMLLITALTDSLQSMGLGIKVQISTYTGIFCPRHELKMSSRQHPFPTRSHQTALPSWETLKTAVRKISLGTRGQCGDRIPGLSFWREWEGSREVPPVPTALVNPFLSSCISLAICFLPPKRWLDCSHQDKLKGIQTALARCDNWWL